jgi:hypothetical protein
MLRVSVAGFILWCSIGNNGLAQDVVLDAAEVKTNIFGRSLTTERGEVFTFASNGSLLIEQGSNKIRRDAAIQEDGRLCGRAIGLEGRARKCYSFRRGPDGSLAICDAIDAGCYNSRLLGLPRQCFDGVPKCQAVRLN